MTLNYRGTKYETADLARAQRQTNPRKGVYRGASVELGAAKASSQAAVHPTLKYRGMSYSA